MNTLLLGGLAFGNLTKYKNEIVTVCKVSVGFQTSCQRRSTDGPGRELIRRSHNLVAAS